MNLVVFGATGSVGCHLVRQALTEGHQVTAFTRDAQRMEPRRAGLRVVEGDVLDRDAVHDAVHGNDAVMCALGMPLTNKDGLRAKGTTNIITGMQSSGVRRLVCLSGLGAGASRAILPVHYRYLLVPLFMRHLYADHERQEALVMNSALDWVIARPASFVGGDETGQYRHGFTSGDKRLKLKISHGDVANFMLCNVRNNNYLRQAANISY